MAEEQPVITHATCPACGSNGCYSEWADGSTYCHACGDKTKGKPKPMKEVVKGEYREVRGIPADICQLYGIQVQIAADGDPVRYAFKYPGNTKYRGYHEKKFWLKDTGTLSDLFGPDFNAGSSKRIYLTEGEFDAASLFWAMGSTYPVKSLPSSSFSDSFLKKNHKYLDSFNEIVLCIEDDAAGKKAAEKLYAAFPSKTWYVPMTRFKDANEFIEQGAKDDLKWAALKPQRWTPENFYVSDSDFARIFEEPPYTFIPTGHEAIDDKIRGMTRGCLTLILAQEGIGKSELLGFFEHATLANDAEVKVAVIHLEEVKSVVIGRLASYLAREKLKYAAGDPAVAGKALDALKQWTENGRLVVMDMMADDDAFAILEYIRIAKAVYGCDFIFIDHIHQVADQGSEGDDDERRILDKLSSRMARLCRDMDIGIVCVSHVNDDGKTRSSRMIRKQAGVVLDLDRDITAEDEQARNLTTVTCSKNRPWSRTGDAGVLLYDHTTGLIEEFKL